jgi:hypothetical protein
MNATYTGHGARCECLQQTMHDLRGLKGSAVPVSETMAIFELDNGLPEEDRTFRVALKHVLFDHECEAPYEENKD